nr:hypothetical protein [uncultured Porphyromonas sp.]
MTRRSELAPVDVIGYHGAGDGSGDHRPADHVAHLLHLHVDGRPLSRYLSTAIGEGRLGRLDLPLELGYAGIEVIELLLRRHIGIEEPLDALPLRAQVAQLGLQGGDLGRHIGR